MTVNFVTKIPALGTSTTYLSKPKSRYNGRRVEQNKNLYTYKNIYSLGTKI